MSRYIGLSNRASGPQASGIADVRHLIWPESAFPFFLTREADALAQIATLLPEGTVLSVYDKVHLVPFGEYLPFQDLMERLGFMQLTKVAGGFIPGDRRRILTAPRAPSFAPLICYEIIFPGAAVPAGKRAGWILNPTNHGGFGTSSGPYQRFQQARLRAIEEGLPLVRA